MKYFKLLVLVLTLFSISCVDKEASERRMLSRMNESFKLYIRDNDLKKDLVTKLSDVKAISYIELTEDRRENENEIYEAKIYMQGTTAYMRSIKVYNLRDTVTCYFDENLKMLRLVNPSDYQ